MIFNSNKKTNQVKNSLCILILSILICKIWTACTNGLNGCQQCAVNGKSCQICLPALYLTPFGGCSACPPDCLTCSSFQMCLTCTIGQTPYAVPSTGNKVCSCPFGTEVNIALNTCQLYQEGYLGYFYNQSLYSGSQGYGVAVYAPVKAGGGGGACPANCKTCDTNGTICTACNNGFGVSSSGTSCEVCQPHCQQCSTSSTQCTKCDAFLYGPYYGDCLPCSVQNCLQCPTEYRSCKSCNSGSLFLRQNKCVPCTLAYCIVCPASISVCVQCQTFYGMDLSAGQCIKCQDTKCLLCGFDYHVCNMCQDIAKLGLDHILWNCQACTDIHCVSCQADRTVCIQCQKGWGPLSGVCLPCDPTNPHCAQCSKDINDCTFCMDGYGPTTIDTCDVCYIGHCKTCPVIVTTCTSCMSPWGLNTMNGQCQPCSSLCQQCSANVLICTACYNDTFHGVDPTHTCSPCASPCITCLPTDYSACASCLDGFFLQNDLCPPCASHCLLCQNLTYCTKCEDGYYTSVSGNDSLCEICPTDCSLCYYDYIFDSPNCTACTSNPDVELINKYPARCLEICGDSVTTVHPCDNQRGVPLDGCNDTCEPMDNFTCRPSSTINGKTECSYNIEIIMSVVEFKKARFENKFKLKLEIYPPLYILQRLTKQQFLSSFKIQNQNIVVTNVQYDQLNNILTIDAEISQTIKQNLKIQFTPEQSVDAEFFVTPGVLIQYQLVPSVYFYSGSQFMLYDMMLYACYGSAALGWIGCILGLILRKLGGIQAMFVVQFGWLSVFWSNSFFFLTFEATKPLKYSNLYHYPIFEETGEIRSLQQPYLEQFSISKSYFANNFNVELVLAILVLIAVMITEIRLRRFRKTVDFSCKLEKQVAQQILKLQNQNQFTFQCLLFIILVNIQYYIFCTVLFFKYGQIKHLYSQLLISFWAVCTIATLILFYMIPYSFGYFRFSFIYKNLFTLSHYYIYIFIVIASTLLLSILSSLSFTAGIPYLLFFIYTLIQKPYKAKAQNYRSCFNIFVSLNWIGFKIFCQYFPTSMTSFFHTLYLLANIILTLLCTIFGIASVIHYYRREKARTNVYDKNDPRYKKYKLLIQLDQMNINAKNKKNPLSSSYRQFFQPNMTLKECSNAMKEALDEGLVELQQQRKYFFQQQTRHLLNSQNIHPQAHQQIKRLKPQDLNQYMLTKKKKNDSTLHLDNTKMTQNILYEQELDKQKKKEPNQQGVPVEKPKFLDQQYTSQKLALKIVVQQNSYINYRGAQQYVNKQRNKKKKQNQNNQSQDNPDQENAEEKPKQVVYFEAYQGIQNNLRDDII